MHNIEISVRFGNKVVIQVRPALDTEDSSASGGYSSLKKLGLCRKSLKLVKLTNIMPKFFCVYCLKSWQNYRIALMSCGQKVQFHKISYQITSSMMVDPQDRRAEGGTLAS